MQDADYMGVINRGSLLWMPPLVEQEYRDVMMSLLYGQLAASKKHSVFTEHLEWREVLRGALQQFGWMPLLDDINSSRAKAQFRLAELIPSAKLPLTASERQAGDSLCAYLATLPGSNKTLRLLQRNIAETLSKDKIDGGGVDPEQGVVTPPAVRECQAAGEARACCPKVAPQVPEVQSVPRSAVAAHFGVILPGRRVEWVSIHFKTQERLAANIFEQQFSGSKVVGKIATRTFVGELSEVRYALFRELISTKVVEPWAKEVIEALPITGGIS